VLVIDASVVVAACLAQEAWAPLQGEELVAPPIVLSEACSALHEARWRGELSEDVALIARERLAGAPVTVQALETPAWAWEVADELGWAKTYDAEYVALARLLGCRLLTVDERLQRGAGRLVTIIGPDEL
jgi:predicted nucleic acid-binding protein